jgi:hypothetical protein
VDSLKLDVAFPLTSTHLKTRRNHRQPFTMAFLYQMLGSKIWPPRDTGPDLTGKTLLITGAVTTPPPCTPVLRWETKRRAFLELWSGV